MKNRQLQKTDSDLVVHFFQLPEEELNLNLSNAGTFSYS